MTRTELLQFMRRFHFAVQSSVSSVGGPQAAVIGIVVTNDFEIVFDTLQQSRKVQNLRRDGRIALVIGGADGEERTVQYEGVVDEPRGEDLERLKALYLARFPDGVDRQSWPGLIYLRSRPTWIRHSDFGTTPPTIVEFAFP